MKILGPLLFAFIAAFGNALFAAGQKKAIGFDNSFVFIALTVIVCVALTLLAAPLLGPTNYLSSLKENWIWAIVSGIGLFLTCLGFNLLYTKYGASHYILYAVISIITTAIVVGVVLFKESFNVYHWLAFGGSIITIFLFTLGNRYG